MMKPPLVIEAFVFCDKSSQIFITEIAFRFQHFVLRHRIDSFVFYILNIILFRINFVK